MFHPRDMGRLAPLLAQAAQRAGGRLIQAMPHETTACYFVIAKDGGSEIGYFDPDCATDYRGRGRLWLSAAAILARHRRCKDFHVPAAPDEFAYYLIKKVLKQSLDDFQLRRLRHLYQRAPVTCCAEALRFWSLATVRRLERALVASDLAWFESHMPGLLAELHASEPVESLGKRVVQKIQSAARVVGRILRPTGMSVLVCGGANEQRFAIATGLVQQLAPAFRRTATVHLDPTGATGPRPGFRLTGKIMVARTAIDVCSQRHRGKTRSEQLVLAAGAAALPAGFDFRRGGRCRVNVFIFAAREQRRFSFRCAKRSGYLSQRWPFRGKERAASQPGGCAVAGRAARGTVITEAGTLRGVECGSAGGKPASGCGSAFGGEIG